MKYSDITKLKILAQDKISRSANPAIVRNSTVFFKSMQEFLDKEKIVKKDLKLISMNMVGQVIKQQLLFKILLQN